MAGQADAIDADRGPGVALVQLSAFGNNWGILLPLLVAL